ncbi:MULTISPECIES: flagellar basal body protein FliL [Amycolatopsis]|uniref:Flagellar basal body protein FliL n=1 Tax=Amycolatopsis dongchuanensis TaxID=1070866 RepID=A0ABP9Q0C0_9PSEU
MTTPGQPGWQQPQQPQQPGWQPYPQQPGYPQQAYPPPGYGPQPGYGQPGYGEQPQPPRKGRRWLIVGLVAALVVLAGGGTTWYLLAQQGSGAASPTEAALKLTSSLGSGDLVGVLDSLAPAEAALFTDPVKDATSELKRLQVLDGNADPNALSGVGVQTQNLTFDEAGAQRVNDHVTITKLTGGTLTITSDFGKLPLAKQFLDALPGTPDAGPHTETIDIAKEVRESGEPVRIATVQVDGEWYPSLLYTIADYALREAGQQWPATSIPAKGAASANDAVKELVQAALDADVQRVIELLPPDEMGVLHDAGPAILAAAEGETEPTGAQLLDLRTQTSPVTGGTRATVTSLKLRDPSGEEYSVTKDGDCYEVSGEGRTQKMCADDLAEQIESEAGSLPSDVREVLRHLSGGILKQGIGVVTTEVNGKHYVSPLRTLTEQGMTVLRSLEPGDFTKLLKLAQ